MLEVTDFISACLDRGSQVDVLYFDFRKAFDRVNNDVLLIKLQKIGFAQGLLRFTANFLKDRQQFVRLGMYDSLPYHTRSGVSQGSIFGPLLFVFMVNDLPKVIKHSKCLLYADDLKLVIEIKSREDCLKLQSDVDAVYAWSNKNKMEFNPMKCHAMTFTRKWHPIQFEYQLGPHEITRSTTMKDLGVTFDRKLTFNDHITNVAKESYRRLGFVMRNSKDFKGTKVIRLLFETLVRSKLEASSCVWNPHEKHYSCMLEKVQKAFLRCLYKHEYGCYPYLYPTSFLLGCLGYNSLEVRRESQQMTLMCKILRGLIDSPNLLQKLSRLFVPDPGSCPRRGRHPLFSVPPRRTLAHAHSPIQHTLSEFNRLLTMTPECDLFADEWKDIMLKCLEYCEMKVCKVTSEEHEFVFEPLS